MLNDLIYISTATLLPLIPAFVIYRTLNRYAPTTARIQGTPGLFKFLKGLKVDLQGAGASYFLLVFIIFGYIYTRPEPTHCVAYSVEGQIELRPKEALNPDAVAITAQPPQVNVVSNGLSTRNRNVPILREIEMSPDSESILPVGVCGNRFVVSKQRWARSGRPRLRQLPQALQGWLARVRACSR